MPHLFSRKPIAELVPEGEHGLRRVLGAGDLVMLAIQRKGEDLTGETTLAAGDSILLAGTWVDLDKHLSDPDVLVVDHPALFRRQAVAFGPGAGRAIAALAGMIVLLVTGVVPGAIAALRSGRTGPDMSLPPPDFAPLRKALADAVAVLQAVTADAIERAAGGAVIFEFSGRRMDFTGEDFLLSFSLPNFFFHASTAYAILRNQGLAIGKRDFLGRVRTVSDDPSRLSTS